MKIHSAWLQTYTIAAEVMPELQNAVDSLLAHYDNHNLYNKIIDYRVFHQGLLTLQELSGRGDFGWFVGSNIPAYGVIPALRSYFSSCHNLAEANTEMLRLQAVAIPACFNASLKLEDDLIKFTLTPTDPGLPKLSIMADLVMALVNASTKRMLNGNFEYEKIHQIDAGYDQVTLSHYSQATLLNNRDQFAVFYKQSWLKVPQKYASSSLVTLLKPVVDAELVKFLPTKNIAAAIEKLLRASNHPLQLKLAQVAQTVGQSETSVRRKLAETKLTFTELQENYLRNEIMNLLSDPAETIDSIASRLGYSERAALERSFKRWHGITPAQFRKQLHFLTNLIQKNDSNIKIDIPPISSDLSSIIDLIEHQESPSRIAKEISKDPTLAAKLIGTANSAFYGAGNVQNLEDAIGRILGLHFVKNIILMNSLIVFSSDKIDPNFNLQQFIFSTLLTELFCRKLSGKIQFPADVSSSDFVNAGQFGLLGQIIFANGELQSKHEWTSEYNKLDSLIDLHHWENINLGMSTYSVSNIILSHWGMSTGTCRILANIGSSSNKTTDLQTIASSIMVIHALIHMHCKGIKSDELLAKLAKLVSMPVDDILERFESCLEKESELKDIAASLS